MRLLLLASILALVLAGCTKPADDAPTPTPETNSTPSSSMAPMEIAISLIEPLTPGVGVPPSTLGIEPSQVELMVGMPAHIVVTNDGQSPHDLNVDELGIATGNLDAGASFEINITPTEAGEFRMYCSLGSATPVTSHDARGMHGTVTVS